MQTFTNKDDTVLITGADVGRVGGGYGIQTCSRA